MSVTRTAYPDLTAFDPGSRYYDPKSTPDTPRWYMVDVKFKRKLKRVIPLETLKSDPELQDMPLVKRGNRLSIVPVTEIQWHRILSYE
jgi:predicted RNA-binding protein with PUA-like domain